MPEANRFGPRPLRQSEGFKPTYLPLLFRVKDCDIMGHSMRRKSFFHAMAVTICFSNGGMDESSGTPKQKTAGSALSRSEAGWLSQEAWLSRGRGSAGGRGPERCGLGARTGD